MKKWIISAKTSRTVGKVCSYILLIFFACIFFMPFLWMLSTAVKPTNQIFLNPPKWIPDPIKWENFATIFKRMPLFAYTKNTLVVAILPVLGQIFAAPMIAYSLTKIPWKGAKYIFPLILATMMIPWQVTQIPLFITWSKLGLVNTFVPLVLPAFFGTPYYIYLMRQFVKGLPDSVIEAARIDGANSLKILFYVTIPNIKNSLALCALLRTIDSFRLFDKVNLLTGGGPANSTSTITQYLYNYGIKSLDFGFGSAGAIVMTILVLILSSVYIKRAIS